MKELFLTNGEKALVDSSDYESLIKYTWSKSKLGYATANIDGQHYFLHRFIMGLSKGDGLIVDHKNGNGLDNRRSNLRVCTKTQNQQNQRTRHTSVSKYKGVGYYKRDKKWRTRIVYNKKDIELGKFECETCAAIAYDEAAKVYHGEYAWLNKDHFEINENLHPI